MVSKEQTKRDNNYITILIYYGHHILIKKKKEPKKNMAKKEKQSEEEKMEELSKLVFSTRYHNILGGLFKDLPNDDRRKAETLAHKLMKVIKTARENDSADVMFYAQATLLLGTAAGIEDILAGKERLSKDMASKMQADFDKRGIDIKVT